MTITITENTTFEDFKKQVAEATVEFRAMVESFGYRCPEPFWDSRDRILFLKGDNRYLPEVSEEYKGLRRTGKWGINMGAYGFVSGEEAEKWFAAQKMGMDFVKKLNSMNLKEVLPTVIEKL